MQYLIMAYTDEKLWPGLSAAAKEQRFFAAYSVYVEALNQSGVLKGMNRLRPVAEGVTVRVSEGKAQVLDGPYAETKEQLGGYFLIDVPDSEAALSWAARCPAAEHGVVEVRPIWEMRQP
ncbi:MAG TPA: YciI family protein [Bryobacteraceae bacterium]|nr:YciI family protein [Bryobacteraceae bacterium]